MEDYNVYDDYSAFNCTVTLVVGSNDFSDYEEFKRILTEDVPWCVKWILTSQTEVGVGALSEQYTDEIWAPLSVYSGDASIKSRKKRLKARTKYCIDNLAEGVVVIWRGESAGGMRSIINQARKKFFPLLVYDLDKKKVAVSINATQAAEAKRVWQEMIIRLEDERRQEEAVAGMLLDYGLSEHKIINIVDRIRHLRKTFEENS